MSEQEPKRRIFDTRFTILVGLQVFLVMLVILVLATGQKKPAADPDSWREVAGKLQAAGLIEQAIPYYEQYLTQAKVEPSRRAAIAYSLGDFYEQQGDFKNAIAWYYQVELADPRSENVVEANKRIVAGLEKLGKVTAAKQALKASTALQEEEVPKGATVVARLGEKNVYLHQVNEALDSLPEGVRKQFESAEGKREFLKKYVADELLYEKAKRLQLAEQPEMQRRLREIEKQVLLNKVLQDEVFGKIAVDEGDLRNYFEANRGNYLQKERIAVSVIRVKAKDTASQVVAQLKEGKSFEALVKEFSTDDSTKDADGKVPGFLVEGDTKRYPKALLDGVWKTKAGKWTEPLLSEGAYHIFLVRSREPEIKPDYEKVREQVAMDYRMSKGQALYQKMVEDALKGEQVQLFAERVK